MRTGAGRWVLSAVVVVLAGMVAAGQASGTEQVLTRTQRALPAAVGTPDSLAVQAAAGGCVPRTAGRRSLPVRMNGHTYLANTYLPRGYSGRHHLALVLNLHGSTHDGEQQQHLSVVRPLADKRAFIAIAPTAAIRDGRGYDWNVPGASLANGKPVPRGARDDVAFLTLVIRAAKAAYCVDPRRIYLMGHSGGARMASAYACRRADVLAGLGTVSGLRAGLPERGHPDRPDPATCRPSRAVPVISFHGTADEKNPYAGGGSSYWGYSVPTAMQAWGGMNRCVVSPLAERARAHVTRYSTMACPAGEVVSYVAAGAGHTWPGSPYNDPVPVSGPTNQEIDATATIWSFFARHRLPA